jgi:hypothetical protein
MDKAFLEKLETSENARLSVLFREAGEEDQPITSFFKSDTVKKTLEKGNQAIMSGFDRESLPMALPFSDRVLVEVCPTCECVKSPGLLEPYLERGLVIPVLGDVYTYFPPEFVESIIGYPYIAYTEFYGIRNFAIRRTVSQLMPKKEISAMAKICLELAKGIRKLHGGTMYNEVDTVFYNLQPFLSSDIQLILDLMNALKKKNFGEIFRAVHISHIISAFRNSQVFSLIPQVGIRQLDFLDLIPQEYEELAFNAPDIRNFIMNGLKISYDPSIPVETYLDIISERKSAIREIVTRIINQAKPEDKGFFSNLRTEIEKVNQEVESLKTSKKRVVFDLLTNFAFQNKGSIVAGLMTAVSLGTIGLGFVGCGAGLTVSLATGALSRKISISIPEEASILSKKISARIEPHYEKMVAETLSFNVQAIQLWHLRRRIAGVELQEGAKSG